MNTHERNEIMATSEQKNETNDPTSVVKPSRWDLTFLSQLSFNELLYHVLFGGERNDSDFEPQGA